MIGLLIGAACYVVALGKWPAALIVSALALACWRYLGKSSLVLAGVALLTAVWIDQALPPKFPDDVVHAESWSLEVTSMPLQRGNGWDFTVDALDGPAAGFSFLVHSSDPTPPLIHDRIIVTGPLSAPDEQLDGVGYLEGMGVSRELYTSEVIVQQPGDGLLNWFNEVREQSLRELQIAVPGDAGALLAGFVTGDDGRLSPDAEDQFRIAGLSHLTAVSGSNLAMLLTMVAVAGRAGGRRRATILFAGVVVLWMYAIFVDLPPPTLRAALLATFAAGGRALGRPIDLIALTLLTVPVQLAIRPFDAWSISFHLSIAASLGLAAGLSRYPGSNRMPGLTELAAATALAQLATLPMVVGVFGTAPILGLMANIAAIPFASFAFGVALAGTMTLWLSISLGTAILAPAGWAAEVVLAIADFYDRGWSRIELGPFAWAWSVAFTLAVLIFLLRVGGELTTIGRQLKSGRR